MFTASTGSPSGGVNVASPTVRIEPDGSSKVIDVSASIVDPSLATLARPPSGA